MNNEEITNEICGCFKMSVDLEGLKKLENYITNLEQENKKLNNIINETKKILLLNFDTTTTIFNALNKLGEVDK